MRGAGSGPVGVPGRQIPANPSSVELCLLGPCTAWCCGAPQHPVLGAHGTAHAVLVPALYPPRPCSPPALHPPALALRAPPHVAPAPLANLWARLDYCCPPALIRSCRRAGRAAPALLAPIPSPGAGVPSRDTSQTLSPWVVQLMGGQGSWGRAMGFPWGQRPCHRVPCWAPSWEGAGPLGPRSGDVTALIRISPGHVSQALPGRAVGCHGWGLSVGCPRCWQWPDLHKAAPR